MQKYEVTLTVTKKYKVISLNESEEAAINEAKDDLRKGGDNLAFVDSSVVGSAKVSDSYDASDSVTEKVRRALKDAELGDIRVIAINL